MRLSPWPLVAAVLALAAPAAADSFIGFTDNAPGSSSQFPLSETDANWAVRWTQTVATHDVTVRALLDAHGADVTGNWWITTNLGADATPADVVASGVYSAPSFGAIGDSNILPRTELASGLSFAAGSYYLVLDGPTGPLFNDADWLGVSDPADTVQLAAGFTVDSYYMASLNPFGGPGDPPAEFGPASPFQAVSADARLVFELDGQLGGVPEPATWALMLGGFGLAGCALRRRSRRGLAGAVAAAGLAFAAPAAADPLIGFTDNSFTGNGNVTLASLSDLSINWAVGWTQTVDTTDVTVRALLSSSTTQTGAWWITTAIGPTATLADVVACGVYTAPPVGFSKNFDSQAMTELASGLSFAAGSYFLVLDGPAGPAFNNAHWIGGFAPTDTTDLAAGFSLGSYYAALAPIFGGPDLTPAAFAPASPFVAAEDTNLRLVFELDGRAAVPEPGTWALMIGGFGAAGVALRRRRTAAPAAA